MEGEEERRQTISLHQLREEEEEEEEAEEEEEEEEEERKERKKCPRYKPRSHTLREQKGT